MKKTTYFAPTLRETPADATATSHKLMLRAGLVKMLSAGVYNYLPLGWSVMRKAMQIIREEMDTIGGQEFQLPALTPVEIWDETGRNQSFGDEMFRFHDRKGHINCLAPTHEEIICAVARGQLRSWRDLPQIWYQIQTKFRDEPRPRGGMLRMRQFMMKDSYSLDRDEEGLDKSYLAHKEAYKKIFDRCGLDYFIVGASSGLMGGSNSQEFMIESDVGEDECARCLKCGYAANLEVATSEAMPVSQGEPSDLTEVSTPDQRTVEEVSGFLKVPESRMVKTLVYMHDEGAVMALVSGEDDLSEDKLMAAVGSSVRPAEPEEVIDLMQAEVGFLGPHGDHGIPILADKRLQGVKGMATGANRNGYHVTGLDFGRDVNPKRYLDLRQVKEGENCPHCGEPLHVVKSIELGHIFKLGTRYSKSMNTVYSDENSKEKPVVMGSYGIGVDRILAASIESYADENGIRWNSALAPLDAYLIPVGDEEEVVNTRDQVYNDLQKAGLKVLLDDRETRPGVKMKDADLYGIPAHIIVSARNLKNGTVEIKDRWTGKRTYVKPEETVTEINRILQEHLPQVKP